MSLLVGMLSNPCLKRVGIQHTRLNVLFDAVEDCLHRQVGKRMSVRRERLIRNMRYGDLLAWDRRGSVTGCDWF